MTEQIRNLLENMFHAEIANSKDKFTSQEMYDELLKRLNVANLIKTMFQKYQRLITGLRLLVINGNKIWQDALWRYLKPLNVKISIFS